MNCLSEIIWRITPRDPLQKVAATFASCWRLAVGGTLLAIAISGGPLARAQDAASAPMAPPPEHDVRRLGTEPEAAAPPSLPPDEIIRRFSQKEDEFLAARPNYGYRKTIRIDEFGDDGKPAGQFLMVTETTRAANGQVISKVVQKPQSTLQYFNLETEDVKELDRIPAFPLTTSRLVKYDLKFIGEEQVDEIDCYIFKVKPKALDRTHAYLDGLIWVDTKYLEVVKTYGRWVNELGDVRSATLPFTLFETYRENVDGKYWFPNYERSDDTLHLKDVNVPVRLVIKWTEFKVLPAMAAPAAVPPATAPQNLQNERVPDGGATQYWPEKPGEWPGDRKETSSRDRSWLGGWRRETLSRPAHPTGQRPLAPTARLRRK
jgi:hypothetical protein